MKIDRGEEESEREEERNRQSEEIKCNACKDLEKVSV